MIRIISFFCIYWDHLEICYYRECSAFAREIRQLFIPDDLKDIRNQNAGFSTVKIQGGEIKKIRWNDGVDELVLLLEVVHFFVKGLSEK